MNRVFKRTEQAIFSQIGDDVVALHVHRGQCYGMEKVTADVWKLLERPQGVEELCAQLIERYEVEPDRCRAEVEALLEQMQTEGLVEATQPDA